MCHICPNVFNWQRQCFNSIILITSSINSTFSVLIQDASLIDGLKTPATPCTPLTPGGEKKIYTWDDSIHLPVLPIRCRNISADLHKNKLGSGEC